MQPDATAGNAADGKRPDFWHSGLASAKLFPHKWPCVPLQIRQRAGRKGPRGMSSVQPGRRSCDMPGAALAHGVSFPTLLQFRGSWFYTPFSLIFKSITVWRN